MDWLNYHHLVYFRTVAHEGGLLPAARKLRVTHSTVGAQVHALEQALGEKLLVRSGRRLVPTPMGRIVLRYADDIASLGRELLDTVRGRPSAGPARLAIGVVDVLPKLVARHLIKPAQAMGEPVRLVVHQDRLERLIVELAAHALDLVLSDAPPPPNANLKVYGHVLGTSDVAIFGTPSLAKRFARQFPASLDGAPMLLPTPGTALRRSLDRWLEARRVRPEVVGEISDSALLKAFAQDGTGVFAAPKIVAREIARQYGVREIGPAAGVVERFHAITAERRFVHPAVDAITRRAREELDR
jgi:LysR family transcriptional activator of nhaA